MQRVRAAPLPMSKRPIYSGSNISPWDGELTKGNWADRGQISAWFAVGGFEGNRSSESKMSQSQV